MSPNHHHDNKDELLSMNRKSHGRIYHGMRMFVFLLWTCNEQIGAWAWIHIRTWSWLSSILRRPHGTQLEDQRVDVHHVSREPGIDPGIEGCLKANVYETPFIWNAFFWDLFSGQSWFWIIWYVSYGYPKTWPVRRLTCIRRARRACEILGRKPRRGAMLALGAAGGDEDW